MDLTPEDIFALEYSDDEGYTRADFIEEVNRLRKELFLARAEIEVMASRPQASAP